MHQRKKNDTEEMISMEEYLFRKGLIRRTEEKGGQIGERKTRATLNFNAALEIAELAYL